MSRTAASYAGRAGTEWWRVAAQVYREESLCWLCGLIVDQSLPRRHRMSRTVDHLVQLCHGGHPTDRAGLRLAHMACNTARSNRLRHVPRSRCACRMGRPCAVVVPGRPRGYVTTDITTL